MSSAPSLSFFKRKRKHLRVASNVEAVRAIEIVVRDQLSTALLLEYAGPIFPASAEHVAETEWVVRLQPPVGGRWVLELLTLVERWLESTRLPAADVRYGGRTYLIRASGQRAAGALMH
ncbi:MAG: hypothetical protein ABI896_09315 [Actinomycetota bacterium]